MSQPTYFTCYEGKALKMENAGRELRITLQLEVKGEWVTTEGFILSKDGAMNLSKHLEDQAKEMRS